MGSSGSASKSALWKAAITLHGSAFDRTDWKALRIAASVPQAKRICFARDEKTARALKTYGDVDPSQSSQAQRHKDPKGCHWRMSAKHRPTAVRYAHD